MKWLWILFGLIPCGLSAQSDYKPLKLEKADEVENQRVDGRDVLKAIGHVQFSHDTLSAWCDQSAFFRDLQMALLLDHVVFNDRHRTIFCEKARYYAKVRKAVCQGNVIFVDQGTTLVADSLVYMQNTEQIFAQGSVVIFDSLESVAIYGEYGFYDVHRKYASVKGNPRLVQYDSNYAIGQNVALRSRGMESKALLNRYGLPDRYSPSDQLTASGRFVESFLDSNLVWIKDSVAITREKLVSRAEKARFNTKTELLEMFTKPTADYETNHMVGDHMRVQFNNKEISTIFVKGNATATSMVGSDSSRINRLTSKEMKMTIRNRVVDELEAEGNAYNRYFMENQEGANEISGPSMILYFNKDGKLSTFKVIGGTQGTYFPESYAKKLK
ncbi:MAG: hypothetical protein KDC45_05260 [Bacteroidetes bacterium]|nr:hypothetical protein [Bacteroidota bacterium]